MGNLGNRAKILLPGTRYGRYVVLGMDTVPHKTGGLFWICRCDCGNVVSVQGSRLYTRKAKQCSQCARFKIKHGDSTIKTRLYRIWGCIKGRCLTQTNEAYRNYGGRGIDICIEWKDDFLAFKQCALSNGYREDLTIERIDNNSGYYPKNCRWATRKEQNRNKRDNHLITINGDTKTLIEWCEMACLPKSTLRWRCKHGWSGVQLIQPTRKRAKEGTVE